MTLSNHDTVLFQLHDLLVANGFDGLADALTVLLNEVMKIERNHPLQAESYERTDARRGYANGYKPRTVKTRVGEVTLVVPWQRCRTHLQRNAFKYIPRKALKAPVAADIWAVFDAPDRGEADRLLEKFVDKYTETAPALAE